MYAYSTNDFIANAGFANEQLVDAGQLQVAIIIPTFNERDNVGELVDRLRSALAGTNWEAIFVDDNSPDGTAARIAEIGAGDPRIRLIHRVGRRGLSSAVVEGMLASIALTLVVMDADLQHDETILPTLLDAIERQGFELAVGTRYSDGGSTGDWNASRERVSQAGTKLSQIFLGAHLSDPMSGFFAVRRDVLMAALPNLSSIGYKILLDLVASSPRRLQIKEVPYTFRSRINGVSKLDSAIMVEFAILLFDKIVGRWVPPRFLMFLCVGAAGLAVHLGVLGIGLNILHTSFWTAQAAAVLISMTGNYVLNNQLTYRDRRRSGRRFYTGLVSFYMICGVGAAANVGIGELIYDDGQRWWVAGMIGAAIGSVWNYAVSSCLTWGRR